MSSSSSDKGHRVKTRVAAVLGLLLWVPAATPTAEPLPSVESILARYREAIGGAKAVRSHRSRRTVGRFELTAQGIGGPLEIIAAAPDRVRLRMELGGLGRIERGFDGKIGWSVDPGVGPRLLEGRELDELRHSAEFYSELKEPSQFASATVLERTTFESKDCFAVRLVRPSGVEMVEYYEVGSGLLVGSRMQSTSVMGTIPTVVVVDEYKTFGGVRMPTKARQRAMGVEWVLITSSVEHNAVPDEAFALPPEIAALQGVRQGGLPGPPGPTTRGSAR
jgi:hypothetical protein